MGSNFSKAQETHLRELEELTRTAKKVQRASGSVIYPVSRKNLKCFLHYLQQTCPAYPEAGTLSVSRWTQLGTYLHQNPRAPMPILTTWKAVMAALQVFAPETGQEKTKNPKSVLSLPPDPPPPPYESPSAPPAPPLPTPTPSASSHSPEPPSDAVTTAIRTALAVGDASLSDAPLACPIEAYPDPANAQQNLYRHITFSYIVIKDVKKGVTEYGVNSPFCQGLLVGLAESYRLTSTDWQLLAKMILSPAQRSIWWQEFGFAAKIAQRQTLPAGATMDLILAKGAANTPQAEAQANTATTEIIKKCALTAFSKLEDVGKPTKSFSNIKQGPTQPCSDFIDQLETALRKQITNDDARRELALRLAYENANDDCRAVLGPHVANPNNTLPNFLRLCRSVGTHTYTAQISAAATAAATAETLAAAFQTRSAPGRGVCFNCGKPGHFRNQCRQPPMGLSNSPTSGDDKGCPRMICPKCRKGFHWANQCRNTLGPLRPHTQSEN